MKKNILALLLSAICLFSVACSAYDIDLSRENNVYDELVNMIATPNNYIGKTITLTSTVSVMYNFSENKIVRYLLTEFNESGEKRALYEIKEANGVYPPIGSKVSLNGTVCNGGYIDISSYNTTCEQLTHEIDALDFTNQELEEIIDSIRSEYHQSAYYEKSVRIFGNCVVQENYKYLLGLDKDGKSTWGIELYDPSGEIVFPETKENTIHPIEVRGKFSVYFEKNIAYACIEVTSVSSIESVLE